MCVSSYQTLIVFTAARAVLSIRGDHYERRKKIASPRSSFCRQWITTLIEVREEPNILTNTDCRCSAFKSAPSTLDIWRYKVTDCIPLFWLSSTTMESCRLDTMIYFTFYYWLWVFEMIPILIETRLAMAIISSWLDLLETPSITSSIIARPAAALRRCDEGIVE